MAINLMIQGTASSVGKSLIVAGLCRIFYEDGYKVAPFKSQNMSSKSYITKSGDAISVAQAMQARCANITADYRLNPIFLKPTGNTGSEVFLNGKSQGIMQAKDYFNYRVTLKKEILAAYESLEKDNDFIVIEGAGSPSEINLKNNDIVNMGLADMLKAPVILVGSIDMGGVFASLYGTCSLFESWEKHLMKGFIINKFRGDSSILKEGISSFESRIEQGCLGIIPYINLNIEDEDTFNKINHKIIVAVLLMPNTEYLSELHFIEMYECIELVFVRTVDDVIFKDIDFLIIPPTKVESEDIEWLFSSHMANKIKLYIESGRPLVAFCESNNILFRLGLYKSETELIKNNTYHKIKIRLSGYRDFYTFLNNLFLEGYTSYITHDKHYISQTNNILVTYVNSFLCNKNILDKLIKQLIVKKDKSSAYPSLFDNEINKLTLALRENLNLNKIYEIMEKGV